MRSFFRYWLPVLLWASVIFGMSTDAGSPRHTSRIIGPLLRWFYPEISDQTIAGIQLGIRKVAHLTEYAILASLLWRARRQPRRADPRPWRWTEAGFAVGLAACFAVTDEWHQSFVPGRDAKPLDVLIDSGGATAGILGIWWLHRRSTKK